MRILESDPRRRVLKLKLEYEEDLWALRFTLKPGDHVVCWTTRDVSIGQSKERKPMIVKIRVEKTEFQPFTGALRISGVIVEGPEEYGVVGKHHTASIKPGDIVVVEREAGWSERELRRLSESGYRGSALVVSADYDEYAIAVLTSLGVRVLEEGYSRIPGKSDERREEAVERYVEELASKIIESSSKHGANIIVVGGPGPLKEALVEKLRESIRDKRIHVDETASGGLAGVREMLRRPSVITVLRDFSVIEAEEILEDFLLYASRDPEKVAYGLKDVLACARLGAVEKMVIVDSLLSSLDDDERSLAEKLMEEAEKTRARVVIVPSDSPPGERVLSMGGVVAKLRFSLPLEVRRAERLDSD